MGEVYRAKDSRLNRDVAIKVLPPAFAGDRERLRRFEQEAQAAGRINHPNILAVYDVGAHEEKPYVVTEYLIGETLRKRISEGPLPVRKAIELAIALAYGLAAAHEQRIIHRDLKPENLFITTDGRLKILDFGLAKLTRPSEAPDGRAAATAPAVTAPADTGPGTVWGTVGYMSPEQVRGQAVDHRSDIFSFGAILYEMVSGRRAFKGESPADTMSAILREEPPDLTSMDREIPLALERIVRHCLEKLPGERFRSAHDLAFQLEGLSSPSGSGALAETAEVAEVAPAPREVTHFDQLTFRRGPIWFARFAPDGQTVLLSAEWEGEAARVYMKRPESPDAIPLTLEGSIAAVSRNGEVATLLNTEVAHNGVFVGTLAQAPMFGGAPRLVAEGIQFVDYSAAGDRLLITRDVEGRGQIEFPVGQVVYRTDGHVSFARIAPDGNRIAFFEHPFAGDDRGAVAVVDLQGNHRVLTPEWTSAQGLAWSPDGSEIWFTAAESGSTRSLYAVTPEGTQRFISGFPGTVRLQDIAPDGRLLLTRDNIRIGISGRAAGAAKERELGWLDWSLIGDLSRDGQFILFDEENEQVGRNYLTCIRRLDGSPAIRLGEGRASSLSPDGRWAVSVLPVPESPIILLPTGPGQPRRLPADDTNYRPRTTWHPDGRRILATGRPKGAGYRLFWIDVESGAKEAATEELPGDIRGLELSPDAQSVALLYVTGETVLLSLRDGSTRPVPGVEPREFPVAFTGDGAQLYVLQIRTKPWPVHRVHLETGRRELAFAPQPEDPGGMLAVFGMRLARDGDAYAYSYNRYLSELYVVRGLR
jgi:hypothetical protein